MINYTAFPLSTLSGITKWVVTNSSQVLYPGIGYFVNAPMQVNMVLPANSNVGDTYQIWDINGNGFVVMQSGIQQILCGADLTTAGPTGSLTSTAIGDRLEIICAVSNVSFSATPLFGTFTGV